jgi:hypothetical protein
MKWPKPSRKGCRLSSSAGATPPVAFRQILFARLWNCDAGQHGGGESLRVDPQLARQQVIS